MCLAFFVCVQKTANQVIIYFILLHTTITISTAQKDDWGNKSEHKNAFFVNKFASFLGFIETNIYGTYTKV